MQVKEAGQSTEIKGWSPRSTELHKAGGETAILNLPEVPSIFLQPWLFLSRNAHGWPDDGQTDGWMRGHGGGTCLGVLSAHRGDKAEQSRGRGLQRYPPGEAGAQVSGCSGFGVTRGSPVPFPAAPGPCQGQGQPQRWTLGVIQSGSSCAPICNSQTLILNTLDSDACWVPANDPFLL